ncbi:unnamed protein product [Wickerhamomyces anomalus]
MIFSKALLSSIALASTLVTSVAASFDAASNKNVVVYWGQASAQSQEDLSYYCDSDDVDIIVASFMISFPGTDNIPGLNFAGNCNDQFSNGLLNCPKIGQDIKYCQSKGKKVLLSLGGAVGTYGFTNDQEAESFADVLWNMFLEGTSDTRPFGDAVIDGIDFDIENANPTGYAALGKKLREYFAKGSKDYYLSAAPQCVYPDAGVYELLEQVDMDFIFIQFYNNYCNVDKSFNWDTWTNYAATISPNKNVKLYVGIPGAPSAAGSGYLDISVVQSTIDSIGNDDAFGGIMMWDASQCFLNVLSDGRTYVEAIKDVLESIDVTGTTTTSSSTTTLSRASSTTTASSSTTTVSPSTTSIVQSSSTSKEIPAESTESTTTTSSLPATTLSSVLTSTVKATTSSTSSNPSTTTSASQDCSSLSGSAKVECLNNNYSNGKYDGNTGSCTTGDVACDKNGGYALCNFGSWVSLGCGAGTTCYAYLQGDNVVTGCNWPLK